MAKVFKDPRQSEKFFRVTLIAEDLSRKGAAIIKFSALAVLYFATILFFLLFVYFIGFSHTDEAYLSIRRAFHIVFILLFFSRLIIGIMRLGKEKRFSLGVRISVLIFSFFIFLPVFGIVKSETIFWNFFSSDGSVIITSFLFIILIGSGLLMLPNSRTEPMRYQDVLFTSVSAVCVTGLTVTNTVSSFSYMGKIIILCLIQLGGLGMMTFTGFFSYLFTSKSSLQERKLLQDIFSSESLGNLFKILIKIVSFTFLLEAIGALVIYYSLEPETTDRVFSSVFHSVSAFCNAGFSVFSNGLMSPGINRNYIFLSAISILIIGGGLGFPVMIRFYTVVKSLFLVFRDNIVGKRFHLKKERLDVGSRIALMTTLILILSGTIILFLAEKNGSMQNMTISGQWFLSYFNSVTARTAGFNMSDLTLLCNPSVFVLILLMWIGASPGSTGGGIKTSTFALALLSSWSNIRGRKSLEIGRTEINSGTLNRVLSIIFLSMLVIGTGFICLLITDPDKNPVHLLFEAVSAFSTTGLSLADSSTLSYSGKSIVMVLMFAGRVGPLTLLTGLFFAGGRKYYRYPGKEIAIN